VADLPPDGVLAEMLALIIESRPMIEDKCCHFDWYVERRGDSDRLPPGDAEKGPSLGSRHLGGHPSERRCGASQLPPSGERRWTNKLSILQAEAEEMMSAGMAASHES
jgi:hypothetical protein